jgi:hypothetical protein
VLGAFVLGVKHHQQNFKRACAILPASGNPCQVGFLQSDPKLQYAAANRRVLLDSRSTSARATYM